MLDDILYPNVVKYNWAMLPPERIALTGLLARLKPRNALEIGTYCGGSLTLMAQFAEKVWALDIDPEVPSRFAVPLNVDLRIAPPEGLVDNMLLELEERGMGLDFVLIDADHSSAGVRRDVETVIHRPVPPKRPMFVLMHDSGNPECRNGIKGASWSSCPYVHHIDLDFVPGQVQSIGAPGHSSYEVWGGFAIAYLSQEKRAHTLQIEESSAKTWAALQAAVQNGLVI